MNELQPTAQAMVAPGKGILAADESVKTISARFAARGITSTEETRRQYRELLLGAPGLGNYASGVILHEETLRQRASDGTPFPALLRESGVLAGIKVDTGAHPLAGAPGETVTEGLDGLRARLAGHRELGAAFAKWRAVISIGPGLPSDGAITANAHALARYAALCQEAGLVPIVEPEVLMSGDHGIERCAGVTRRVLAEVFTQLRIARVELTAMVLKPSMVLPGDRAPAVPPVEVAAATVACMVDTVPASVPGVAFLSGGQAPQVATAHLDAIARLGPHPWAVTFSFGRALQDDALDAWAGDAAHLDRARKLLTKRLECNARAAQGCYEQAMEAA